MRLKSILSALFLGVGLTANAQYQLQNNGFEEWADQSYKKVLGEEPLHWSSFITGSGKKKSDACTTSQLFKSEDVRAGSTGRYSAGIKVNYIRIVKTYAQGNMTTGRVNMGNISPKNPGKSESENIANRELKATGNYNFTDLSDDNHNQKFTGRPDAMRVYVKYTTTGSKGKIAAYLHSNAYYQDPLPKDGSHSAQVIASAVKLDLAATKGWEKVEIPVTYESKDKSLRPSYALVSFATSATPGEGNDGDEMLIDDVEFLYNSELSSIKYKNAELYRTGTTAYVVDDYFDEASLSLTSNAQGGSIVKDYNEETGLLTITVKGDDDTDAAPNRHVYTIQFKPDEKETSVYMNSLQVQVAGSYTPLQQNVPIKLINNKTRNSYSFLLEDFSFLTFEMGDIQVDNLTKNESNDVITYTGSQDIYIDMIGADVTANVTAKVNANGEMVAEILIPENDDMPYDVKVSFAPALTINPSEPLEVSNATGLTNVVMSRTFAAGWNTYCMPFDYNLSSLSAEAKAQEFVSSNGYSLTFEAVNDGVLKANVPYLVYFPAETTVGTTEEPLYFVTNVASYQPTSVEHNGFTFVGNYEASKSMEGLYGVASEGDVQKIMLGTAGSTLPATCAYFTTKNMNNGLRICFDGGEVTGINQVNGAQAQSAGAVYNLQGIKVSNRGTNNLPAGLYIMQGKKVIVK